ncbi:MAG: DegT/DnrJ/EryC1/StrS family aminotransferase [Pseudomonadota bacterium]
MKTFVSKIYLPEKEKFVAYIDKIYESGWLTNNGPLVQELEQALEAYLGVKNLLLTASGTAALQIAMKTLDLEGEAITTPFTYVATSSALVAEKVKPVFVDIDADTLNIDPDKIEAQITADTTAIVPVHVFGNVCDVEAIEAIAKRHNLRVIYDAAHTFGIKFKGRSVFSYGDISTVSFHATKIFHTIEGGAVIVNDDSLYAKAKAIRNYGMDDSGEIAYSGVNGKLNEVSAAMGLCNVHEIDRIIDERRRAFEYYTSQLQGKVGFQHYNPDATMNYSYISALFKDHAEMSAVRSALAEQEIYPRQYFYPSLETAPFTGSTAHMPISGDVVSRILVLPMHSGAERPVTETILNIVG